VVTGRFVTRSAGNVVLVSLANGTEIRATDIHPVWSVDREEWVPAGELEPGEQVDTLAGPVAVVSVERLESPLDVYNIEVHGEHVFRVTADGVLVHNAGAGSCGINLNSNAAVARFGIYEITVYGSPYKIGKAHLDRITAGLPTRLHQQVRKLQEVFGRDNVIGSVVDDLGKTTTKLAKDAEFARILKSLKETGFVPLGNWKSFKP
jgi:hypothetical protein